MCGWRQSVPSEEALAAADSRRNHETQAGESSPSTAAPAQAKTAAVTAAATAAASAEHRDAAIGGGRLNVAQALAPTPKPQTPAAKSDAGKGSVAIENKPTPDTRSDTKTDPPADTPKPSPLDETDDASRQHPPAESEQAAPAAATSPAPRPRPTPKIDPAAIHAARLARRQAKKARAAHTPSPDQAPADQASDHAPPKTRAASVEPAAAETTSPEADPPPRDVPAADPPPSSPADTQTKPRSSKSISTATLIGARKARAAAREHAHARGEDADHPSVGVDKRVVRQFLDVEREDGAAGLVTRAMRKRRGAHEQPSPQPNAVDFPTRRLPASADRLIALGWALRIFAGVGVAGSVKLMLWAAALGGSIVDSAVVFLMGVGVSMAILACGEAMFILAPRAGRQIREAAMQHLAATSARNQSKPHADQPDQPQSPQPPQPDAAADDDPSNPADREHAQSAAPAAA